LDGFDGTGKGIRWMDLTELGREFVGWIWRNWEGNSLDGFDGNGKGIRWMDLTEMGREFVGWI